MDITNPPLDVLENITFDEIKVGDSATLSRTVHREDIQLFAVVSGDVNPSHLDRKYAEESQFGEVTAHGMLSGAMISALLGNQFPGPGTVYVAQNLRFKTLVHIGDTLSEGEALNFKGIPYFSPELFRAARLRDRAPGGPLQSELLGIARSGPRHGRCRRHPGRHGR